MNAVHIYVCGILNIPGEARAWTDRATIWTHINTQDRAEKYEYLSGALALRSWFNLQTKRAKDLLWMTEEFAKAGWSLNWVGHSNGAEVIHLALTMSPLTIDSVTLLAPACEADCEKNGLNAALYDGKVRRLAVHYGDQDDALKWAKIATTLVSWMGLGYGNMGSKGPMNVGEEVKDKVEVHKWEGFGHSTFFEDDKFDGTMKAIHRIHPAAPSKELQPPPE